VGVFSVPYVVGRQRWYARFFVPFGCLLYVACEGVTTTRNTRAALFDIVTRGDRVNRLAGGRFRRPAFLNIKPRAGRSNVISVDNRRLRSGIKCVRAGRARKEKQDARKFSRKIDRRREKRAYRVFSETGVWTADGVRVINEPPSSCHDIRRRAKWSGNFASENISPQSSE